MTRKEAARQLAIPEGGGVASRLARARVMLAKRLTRPRRRVLRRVGGGGVVGGVGVGVRPAAWWRPRSRPQLLAAGQAAGVVSA